MTSTLQPVEDFIAADDQLHRATLAAGATCEIAWDCRASD